MSREVHEKAGASEPDARAFSSAELLSVALRATAAFCIVIAVVTLATQTTRWRHVRISRPAASAGGRLVVDRVSRSVLAADRHHAVPLPPIDGCVVHVATLNADAHLPLVFTADVRHAGGKRRQVLQQVVEPRSGWLEQTAPLPSGSRGTLELSVGGNPWTQGFWSVPSFACPSANQKLFNVLLISLDTLRADCLSAYGGPTGLMPNLEGLASRGTVFTNAYAQYPQTLGSHATLFTALYPSEHGVVAKQRGEKVSKRLANSRETLAKIFARNGYATVAFTENAFVGSSFGFDAGFDLYDDGPVVDIGSGFPGNAADTFAKAAAWLERRPRAPFFMFVHTYEVHTPYAPSEHALARVCGQEAACNDPDRPRIHLDSASVLHNLDRTRLDTDAVAWARSLYDAEAAGLDDQIGVFFEHLGRLGLERDTIVVILSDHGEEFSEHGLMGHGHTLHEEVLRVPLILLVPGGAFVRSVSRLAGLIDVGPTVIELAGLDDSFGHASGRSLAGEVLGTTRGLKQERGAHVAGPILMAELNATYTACPNTGDQGLEACAYGGLSVRDGRYNYIHAAATGEEHLYSLSEDRAEREDLATRDPDTTSRYRRLAESFRDRALPAQASGTAEIDEQTAARLRALGYLQ